MMSRRQTRHAFSLLELMVAIVILGIGLVMVATVFPVGLDMASESIQMNLSYAVVDSAIATLEAKVPMYDELDTLWPVPPNSHAQTTQRMLVPDVQKLEIDDMPDVPDTSPKEMEMLLKLRVPPTPASLSVDVPISYPNWIDPNGDWLGYARDLVPAQLSPAGWDPYTFVDHTRVFTERTGWAGELNVWSDAAPLPAQNLPVDTSGLAALPVLNEFLMAVPTMLSPAFANPGFLSRVTLPRVHLVDQVYPAVSIQNLDGSDRAVKDVLADLRSRRYSWFAFNHKVSSDPSVSGLLVTVLVLHRSDLNARYARQADVLTSNSVYDVDYDLAADRNLLLLPRADTDAATDMLFPRPWLVLLNEINSGNGEVRCTADVARLLPAGSFFVVARSNNGLFAGTPHEVLKSEFDPDQLPDDPMNPSAVLQINSGGGATLNNVLVWVFPPAIQTRVPGRPATFGPRSPVVGVAMRRVGS